MSRRALLPLPVDEVSLETVYLLYFELNCVVEYLSKVYLSSNLYICGPLSCDCYVVCYTVLSLILSNTSYLKFNLIKR